MNPQSENTPGNTRCELWILLGMDLAPVALRGKVAQNLVHAIRMANNCPTVGLIGMQSLMSALEHEACEEAAFSLVINEHRPGWGYMIRKGATTIRENWDTYTRYGGRHSATSKDYGEAYKMPVQSSPTWRRVSGAVVHCL